MMPWPSWSPSTTAAGCATRSRGRCCSASSASTAGPCGARSRRPSVRSTSTSGPGGWKGSTAPSKASEVRVSASSSTRCSGMTDGEEKLTPGDGKPGGAAQAGGPGGRDLPDPTRLELPRRAVSARGDTLLAGGHPQTPDGPEPPAGRGPAHLPGPSTLHRLPSSLASRRSSVQAAPHPSEPPISANPGLPSRARVVVIGGGVIGTSVAYHLVKRGWTDVLLLEQGQLSCGTTWHAAGLVGQLRASENGTRLVQYSTELYARLEEETGLSTGFRRCGGVTVARTEDRMTQLRRTAATAEAFQLECELISPKRARELYPVMRADDLKGAIWLPGDGKANPTDLTF